VYLRVVRTEGDVRAVHDEVHRRLTGSNFSCSGVLTPTITALPVLCFLVSVRAVPRDQEMLRIDRQQEDSVPTQLTPARDKAMDLALPPSADPTAAMVLENGRSKLARRAAGSSQEAPTSRRCGSYSM